MSRTTHRGGGKARAAMKVGDLHHLQAVTRHLDWRTDYDSIVRPRIAKTRWSVSQDVARQLGKSR